MLSTIVPALKSLQLGLRSKEGTCEWWVYSLQLCAARSRAAPGIEKIPCMSSYVSMSIMYKQACSGSILDINQGWGGKRRSKAKLVLDAATRAARRSN